MASYSDVLKFEAEAPANTVRLIKSGEFYRAYNHHSAWLFQCCIAEYRCRVMLEVSRMMPDLPRDCRYTLGQEMREKVMEHTSGMSKQLTAWEKSEIMPGSRWSRLSAVSYKSQSVFSF